MTQRAFPAFEGEDAGVGVVETDREILGRGIESKNTHRGIVSETIDPPGAVGLESKTDGSVILRKELRETVSPFDEGE